MIRPQLSEMATHAELAEMAQMCAAKARAIRGERAAAEFWAMALDYQEQAARLEHGRKPYIGPAPTSPELKKLG